MDAFQDILKEARKNKYSTTWRRLKNYEVIRIWDTVASIVKHNLVILRRGVVIPDILILTISKISLEVSGSKCLVLKRPVCIVNEKLLNTHQLEATDKPVSGSNNDVTVVPLNLTQVARDADFRREEVDAVLKEISAAMSRIIALRKPVDLYLDGIGCLRINNNRVKMRFFKSFVNSVDGCNREGSIFTSRPGTAESLVSEDDWNYGRYLRFMPDVTIMPNIQENAEQEQEQGQEQEQEQDEWRDKELENEEEMLEDSAGEFETTNNEEYEANRDYDFDVDKRDGCCFDDALGLDDGSSTSGVSSDDNIDVNIEYEPNQPNSNPSEIHNSVSPLGRNKMSDDRISLKMPQVKGYDLETGKLCDISYQNLDHRNEIDDWSSASSGSYKRVKWNDKEEMQDITSERKFNRLVLVDDDDDDDSGVNLPAEQKRYDENAAQDYSPSQRDEGNNSTLRGLQTSLRRSCTSLSDRSINKFPMSYRDMQPFPPSVRDIQPFPPTVRNTSRLSRSTTSSFDAGRNEFTSFKLGRSSSLSSRGSQTSSSSLSVYSDKSSTSSVPPEPCQSSCGHKNSGQELCYICHQRANRNIFVSHSEARRKQEQEQDRALYEFQMAKNAIELVKIEDEHKRKMQQSKEVDEYNLQAAEKKVAEEKRFKNNRFHPSSILHHRLMTPPTFIRQEQYRNALEQQITERQELEEKLKKDRERLEKLEQTRLAQELSAEREDVYKQKFIRRDEYRKALASQIRLRSGSLDRGSFISEQPYFGKTQPTEDDLKARRLDAAKMFKQQYRSVMEARQEERERLQEMVKKDQEHKEEIARQLMKESKEMVEREVKQNEMLKRDWEMAAEAKMLRDRDQKVHDMKPCCMSILDQCDPYRRCKQCQRKLSNTGATNVLARTRTMI